ncbi:hypothetical protein CS8_067400 [Cupriavidus sp. 8B]
MPPRPTRARSLFPSTFELVRGNDRYPGRNGRSHNLVGAAVIEEMLPVMCVGKAVIEL